MKYFKEKSSILLAASTILTYLAPSSILAEVAQSFPNASEGQIKMIVSAPSMVAFVFSMITIFLAPHIYKRTLIIFSTALIPIAGFILYFYNPGVEFMIGISALMGIPLAVNVAVIPGLIRETLPEKDCAVMLGFMGAAISVGLLIMNFLVGQLSKNDWRNSYIAYMLAAAIVVYDILFLPKGRKDPGLSLKNRESFKIPPVLIFCTLFYMLFELILLVFQSNISVLVHLKNMGGPAEASYVNMAYNIFGIVSGIVAGIIVPKVKGWVMAAAVLVGAAGMFIGCVSGAFPLLLIGGGLLGASYSANATSVNYYAAVYTTDANRTLCVALVNMCGMLAMFLSPIVFGFTGLSADGLFMLAAVLFAALAAATVPFALISRKQ